MVLSVEMSGRWSYPPLKPSPGKQRERGQEMACRASVALRDDGDRFGQATSRVCTDKMCAPRGPRIVAWTQRTTTKASYLLRFSGTMRRTAATLFSSGHLTSGRRGATRSERSEDGTPEARDPPEGGRGAGRGTPRSFSYSLPGHKGA